MAPPLLAFLLMTGAASADDRLARQAFQSPLPGLSLDDGLTFKVGNGVFKKFWAPSPTSTLASDGLGPFFNARSCHSCHIRDGRGDAPDATSTGNILFKLFVPDGHGGYGPDPVYGSQMQDQAVTGLAGEARATVAWRSRDMHLADGTTVTLRVPDYSLTGFAFGAPAKGLELSPRIAPPLIGDGLLEAIPEADIRALADPDDRNGDGISGRVSEVAGADGKASLGRFGWKASEPTVESQIGAAFFGDMGLSTHLKPDPQGDCTAAEGNCRAFPNGVQASLGPYEVPDKMLDLVTYYVRHLAVPKAASQAEAAGVEGKKLFASMGCAACHHPDFTTAATAPAPIGNRAIRPYSDLLLHDLGPDLASGGPAGQEWRTAPLWGIGYTEAVNPKAGYLHDGRARSPEEAILWHGGEAELSRKAYMNASKEERDALLNFLKSL
ncbi:di-heme oxidoreductase family protein [Oryzibacter oryziterrae]|uniref:di-heme oxidoreductase family protein n=1 Tax=Oryzibacter oryziterrae TaxID=2766474 RepID=UPI001F007DA4|nr:di-heme oxidoredictase family protein [Oryzibacter oryziterrae]